MKHQQARNLRYRTVVEAQGHLVDSHIMERIFDTVVEFGGRFDVEQFHIGRTNSDPSRYAHEGRGAMMRIPCSRFSRSF